ncbi:hypothetical protein ABZ070_17440 [Streptomyces sp. NPDC006283]|uniref:hypothetical protein n=1 Tax=Streptomyces sp. NPDC006283 TaxID=3156741 RepID=UPI0033A7739E
MQSWTSSIENGLRLLLNEWDPIGVADDVQDEYDCMLAPLLRQLRSGANQMEIGAFLRHELEDHFGLDPLGLCPEAMAARVIAWWTATSTADGTGSS